MDEIIFQITVTQVQDIAKSRIGRELNSDELEQVKKGIVSGLSFDMDTVIISALDEVI